jgi:hypothetical protein
MTPEMERSDLQGHPLLSIPEQALRFENWSGKNMQIL